MLSRSEPTGPPATVMNPPLRAKEDVAALLEGIADGMDNAQLAASLGVSEKTVRNHIPRIFDKTNVKHRYEAIVLAREAGLGANSRLTRVR